ncbi:hypothetical protein pb186bvf_013481 [Paramecium bursaria]
MDSNLYIKMYNEQLIQEILREEFQVQDLQKIIDNVRQPKSSNSPTLSPQMSPVKSKPTVSTSIPESKELGKLLIDIVTNVTQSTVQDFILGLKIERVPIQKNILKKTSQNLERHLILLQAPQIIIQKLQSKILQDQTLLVFALCHISKPIMDFFENHFTDFAEELQITIQEVNLALFQPKLIDLIREYVIQTMSLRDDSLYHHILDQCPLHQLVHEASEQICLVLEESRGYVENLIIKFKEKAQVTPLMNKFVMLALFMELSRNCYQTIQDLLEFTIFHYAEPDVNEKFMKYAIENYDTLILKNKDSKAPKQTKSRKTLQQILDQLHACITNKNKSVSVYKIQNKYEIQGQEDEDEEYSPTKILASQMTDTRSFSTGSYTLVKPKRRHRMAQKLHLQGLYIESDEPQLKFIVYMFRKEFVIIYAPLVSKRWTFQKTFVIDPQGQDGYFRKESERKSGWGVYPVKFKTVKDMIDSPWVADQLTSMITWQQLSVDERYQRVKNKKLEGEMDTMFGMFLANLSRTNKLQQFLYSFGENAVNNGCMTQLIQYMPLFKEFLDVGGFGNQALTIHKEVYAPERKITPVGTLVTSTSLVSGAIIGQVLIPIPLVGGIVGGILGGYLGNKGINSYFKERNLKNANELAQKLVQQQQQDGSWTCSKAILDLMNINFKILNDTIPKILKDDLDKQTKWLNLSIFGFLSIYIGKQQEWPECLEMSLKSMAQVLDTLDNLKNIIDIIIKNL